MTPTLTHEPDALLARAASMSEEERAPFLGAVASHARILDLAANPDAAEILRGESALL